jgi:uncharacterized iron-regulated membrane protein
VIAPPAGRTATDESRFPGAGAARAVPRQRRRARKVIRGLHLATALGVGWVLALAGLTGSVLVFGHEIDALLNPGLLRVDSAGRGRLPVQRMIDAARAEAQPAGASVQAVFLPQADRDTCQVHFRGSDRRVFVDPYSARVLGTRPLRGGLVGFLFAFHADLFGGSTGRTVVGVLGVWLLVLSVTGLILWWPPRGQLLNSLTVQWRRGTKRTLFDLHRAGGAWGAPLLILSGLTGAALCFPAFFSSAARALDGTNAPAPLAVPPPAAGQRPLGVDELLARAGAALPGGSVTRVAFPGERGGPVVVRTRLPGEPHPNGMSFVHLDGVTGRALRADDARAATAPQHALNLRYPLHIGSIGGWPIRLATAAAGVLPAALLATGWAMWRNRRRGQRLAKSRRRTVAAVSAAVG